MSAIAAGKESFSTLFFRLIQNCDVKRFHFGVKHLLKRLIFKSTKYIWQVHNLSIPTGDETFRVKCFLHISPLLILYYAKPHYLHTLNRYRKRLFLPSPQFVLGEGPKGKVQTLLNQPVAGEQLLYLLNIHGVILYKGIREKNLIKYIKF